MSDPRVAPLLDGLERRDRSALARAITLIESTRPTDQAAARTILSQIDAVNPATWRVGISGLPGAGKSTLIDRLGMHYVRQGHRVAVLAVDPSSPTSGGSVLGDKTRMEQLSRSDDAFIRPSPTRRHLGGVSLRTRETIQLCEAAGYDRILIETVGVGQSEAAITNMVDYTVLLLLPGGGDALQGIKRGLLELADFVVMNKADGENREAATEALRLHQQTMHTTRPTGRMPQFACHSTHDPSTFTALVKTLDDTLTQLAQEAAFSDRRLAQRIAWYQSSLLDALQQQLQGTLAGREDLVQLRSAGEARLRAGTEHPTVLADRLLNALFDPPA